MSDAFLVLGLAAGYHYGDMKPFAASLERSGFRGRCLLFVSPTTREAERLEPHGVETLLFKRPAEMEHVPYNAWRYFLYRDWLREHGREFGRVLLTDTRDVVFQRDPASVDWPGAFCAALEDPSASVGSCPHTSHWLRGHLGDAALAEVAAEPLSCSGTSVGDPGAVLDYLERMTARLLPFTPGPRMAGYDQGLHNHLLRRDPPPGLCFLGNDGPILTLGSKPGEPELSKAGEVLNDAGLPAALVHQYDRKPALFRRIRALYS